MRLSVSLATFTLPTILAACAQEGPPAADSGEVKDAPGGDDPSNGEPTYWRDVRPVLDRVCARCHNADGIAMSFDDVATVRSLASLIASATAEGRMPPGAPDPTCADYEGSESLFLGEEEKALLASWAAAGAPEGDPADAPAPFAPETTGPFDVELRGEAPYTPRFSESGNDYRCFALDVGNETAAWVTGFEALVDASPIVHHIVLWKVPDAWEAPASDDGEPGWTCDGFGSADWEFFAGWAPGGRPVTFPAGAGMHLPSDARFVMQMHYYDGAEGAPLSDWSGYGLHLADDVETPLAQLSLGVEGFVVPAGAADHTETMWLPWSWGDVTMLGVFPHMHVLGSAFDIKVHRSDDTETCITRIEDWDFHNQQAIVLKEPVTVHAGDIVEVTCHWDNSAENPDQPSDPPQDVPFGEETGQEMCYAFTYGYAP